MSPKEQCSNCGTSHLPGECPCHRPSNERAWDILRKARLIRYEHGGGRFAVIDDRREHQQRELVADFYNEDTRELIFKLIQDAIGAPETQPVASNLHVDTLLLEEIGDCILRLTPEAEERFVGLGVGSLRALQRMVQSKLDASRARRSAVETTGELERLRALQEKALALDDAVAEFGIDKPQYIAEVYQAFHDALHDGHGAMHAVEPTRRIPPREFDIESHAGLYTESAAPRGKPCTCDNCLGSSASCRVEAGERLGDLWYCRKAARAAEKASGTRLVEQRNGFKDGSTVPEQPAAPPSDKCEHGIPRQFCTAVHAEKTEASLPPCECLLIAKEPSAYHALKCPRFVANTR